LHILGLLKSRKKKNGMKIMLLCEGEEPAARFKLRNSIADCALKKSADRETLLSTLQQWLTNNSDNPRGK